MRALATALASAIGLTVAIVACSSSSESSSAKDVDASSAEASAPAPPSTLAVIDDARIGSHSEAPNFQKATGEFDPSTTGPFAEAKLVVDLTSSCFPFDKWQSDPPPSGQYWPASCDAFDRNFEIALFDPANDAAPGIELIRAITPFGGPLHLEADVTDLMNTVHGKRRMEITIPSYSDGEGKVSGSNGGWNVSAHIELTPGAAPRKVLAVVPVVYDSDTKGGAERALSFALPEGTTSTRIEYLATGHGGGAADADCIGPAEEFCKRNHTLTVDGAVLVSHKELWRTDCKNLCTVTKGGPFGDYCLQNPCGSQSSVKAPRANWCPGSETSPLVVEPESLGAGDHTFGITINKVADGGLWRISAKVFAYAD
ncbi:hypothetical protein AKJ09_00827 [Labilithrix luteola]|uniref:Peptide-N-glycosidase F C-terminal domain-containing protein n=1 Tax=Labilithrix luteola TaxID=1391654 RepID=A0A0K1PKU6_9BACT|nr:peptide-N-glycosidase F-related protein [Labilithrix luteola]AKU94163.1 hypothetical protein AKJ09_00827 [Labilithrix luteola]